MTPTSDGPKLTLLGKLFIVLFILACIAGAYYLFMGKKAVDETRQAAGNLLSGGPQVEIGIAYGTEKQRWLEWAVSEFAKTSEGKRITVNLIPMGSLEGAHAILSGDHAHQRVVPGQRCVQRHLRSGMAGEEQWRPDPERRTAGAHAHGIRGLG